MLAPRKRILRASFRRLEGGGSPDLRLPVGWSTFVNVHHLVVLFLLRLCVLSAVERSTGTNCPDWPNTPYMSKKLGKHCEKLLSYRAKSRLPWVRGRMGLVSRETLHYF